ncbi:Poly(U)-specific endoribonuclease-A [Linum perenne]
MDGLIRGVADVVLGHDRDDKRDEQQPRSSWAEVVSGDNDDQDSGESNPGRRQPAYHSAADVDRREGTRRDESEIVDSNYSRPPQKAEFKGHRSDDYQKNQWTREEGAEKSNDEWETVGKKHPKQSHKVVKDNWHGYKQAASEQKYAAEYVDTSDLQPSQQELSDLSCACNKLWELDVNRLIPEKDYQIDCGEGKKVYQKDDMAEGSLFCWLSEDVFRKPTYSRFCSLLDNYNPNEGSKEVVTSEEKQEQAAFLEEISRTAPIKYLHNYLAAKGIVSGNRQDFMRTMSSLWFDLYNRGGTYGSSSAFEHVFVGEIKQRGEQEVSGFHNWLQFYLEEAKGNVDYQGYIFPRRRGQIPDSESQLLTIQFEWNGVLKSVSSTMIGVSPEFEIALYTLCFYAGGEENHVELGPYSVNIKCYRFGNRLGSAFPMG